ncbi:hypothetical protein AS359_11560 [Comamonas kerstersii]|uniref:Uncharacterized protein n=1 Tax=Comamonas kerstersii TaxID=225992 RepID=A0A0W7YTH9_9BURK|nr:hypothetical protein AS359_11560 [Comamonas kerstersii]
MHISLSPKPHQKVQRLRWMTSEIVHAMAASAVSVCGFLQCGTSLGHFKFELESYLILVKPPISQNASCVWAADRHAAQVPAHGGLCWQMLTAKTVWLQFLHDRAAG